MKRCTWYVLPLLIAASLAISACNVFDPMDNPDSDAQILSAARAAFDQGRFEEASAFYSQLSSEYAEVAASESAFQILDQYGASMGAFMSTFGKGMSDIGVAFTRLSAKLVVNGGTPGKEKRLAIFDAFKKIDAISSNPELRGLIRFVAGAALIAEILAENKGSSGLFTKQDLVVNPTACAAFDSVSCALAPDTSACAIPGGKVFDDGGSSFRLSLNTASRPSNPAAEAALSAVRPNFQMVQAALQEINYALTTEIAASGELGGTLQGFSQELITTYGVLLDAKPDCYRNGLLLNGIGVN